MTATEYRLQVEKSFLLVAHAGMGLVIAALTARKPILMLPRRGYLNETRNDHQFATALKLRSKRGITVVLTEAKLHDNLYEAWRLQLPAEQVKAIPAFADEGLIMAPRGLVHSASASGWIKPATGSAAAIDSANSTA